MNIAVVGASGYIGTGITEYFKTNRIHDKIYTAGRHMESDIQLDLSNILCFDESQLDDVDYMIFASAVSGPDQCDKEQKKAWKINVDRTVRVIRYAVSKGCRVLFLSSDAVYGDITGRIYSEEAATEPRTAYGKMKKAVEDAFGGESLFKSLRLSYVASAHDKFISYCLACMEKGETADIFHPFYRNCVTMTEIIHIVDWFRDHFDDFESSVLNVCGTELVSRVRIADELNRIYDGKLNYTITRVGDEFFANRPRITQMESRYLYEYGILESQSFSERLKKELEGTKR